MKTLLFTLPLAAMIVACSPKSNTSTPPQPEPVPSNKILVRQPSKSSMPKATAFRMSGDYAQNVAITPGPDGSLLYYPAPSDVSEQTAPLQLEGGWWLNRQGISSASVFTTYTFSDYSKLPVVPSQAQLLEAVIPGAKVTEIVILPYTISEASSHISEINDFLKSHDEQLKVE